MAGKSPPHPTSNPAPVNAAGGKSTIFVTVAAVQQRKIPNILSENSSSSALGAALLGLGRRANGGISKRVWGDQGKKHEPATYLRSVYQEHA